MFKFCVRKDLDTSQVSFISETEIVQYMSIYGYTTLYSSIQGNGFADDLDNFDMQIKFI